MIEKLNKTNYDSKVKNNKSAVIFSAPWCNACHQMIRMLDEENSSSIQLFNADISSDESLAEKFSIRGLPTTILYNKGIEIGRLNGFQTLDNIQSMFE